MTSFLIPLTWGGDLFPWSSWHTLVPLSLGVMGLVAFVLYEMFLAEAPFLLGSIFRDRNAKLIYIQTFLHGLVVSVQCVYVHVLLRIPANAAM